MGREFELKYRATPPLQAALRQAYPGNWQTVAMETTYYDTPDGRLGDLHWTLRRRMENGKFVCTLKTPAGGLSRGEWETECADIIDAIPALLALGAPKELEDYTAQGVAESCGAKFTRLAGLLEAENCTVELALDEGILMGGGKELPFTEVEVELKAGSEEAAAAFAAKLAEEFGLTPEYRSKVARARALSQK